MKLKIKEIVTRNLMSYRYNCLWVQNNTIFDTENTPKAIDLFVDELYELFTQNGRKCPSCGQPMGQTGIFCGGAVCLNMKLNPPTKVSDVEGGKTE